MFPNDPDGLPPQTLVHLEIWGSQTLRKTHVAPLGVTLAFFCVVLISRLYPRETHQPKLQQPFREPLSFLDTQTASFYTMGIEQSPPS
jgi:hypothetical protein